MLGAVLEADLGERVISTSATVASRHASVQQPVGHVSRAVWPSIN